MNVLIYNFVAMRNLNSFCKMTSNEAHDLIYSSEVPNPDCEFLILSCEKGGLTHFYIRRKKVFERILSDLCMNWSIECGGRILQLDFCRHKALGYVNDDGELNFVGVSFVNVEYASADGGYCIKAEEELPWKGSLLVPLRERKHEIAKREIFVYPERNEIKGI